MKTKETNHPRQEGFTLIEVIVTLVIAAIVGAMLVTLMGKSFTGSAVPVGLVGDQYKIVQEMEKITTLYREEIKKGTSSILSSGNPFKDYIDTNAAGYVAPSPATGLITLTSTTGGSSYPTQQFLRVTLRSGDQSLQAFFTQ
jgi:prepilin-type N-terminal cleavage/methylation domain-containing protein